RPGCPDFATSAGTRYLTANTMPRATPLPLGASMVGDPVPMTPRAAPPTLSLRLGPKGGCQKPDERWNEPNLLFVPSGCVWNTSRTPLSPTRVVWRKATGVDGEATDDRHTGYLAMSIASPAKRRTIGADMSHTCPQPSGYQLESLGTGPSTADGLDPR